MKALCIKTLLPLLFTLFVAFAAQAQFQNVYIGVNGLTCSQCSRTVELSIRKLDFVADVQMNLEHTEGKIILKKNAKADMDKVAQAVVNAGFSVRYLQADLTIDNSIITTGSCFSYQGDQYIFTAPPKAPLKGTVKLKFIGKKYMAKNDYKKVAAYMNDKCGKSTGTTYHVSI